MTDASAMPLMTVDAARAAAETFSARLSEPSWLLDRRLQAASALPELPMPSFKHGSVGVRADAEGFFVLDPVEQQSSQDLAAFGPSGTGIRLLALADAARDPLLATLLEAEALRLFPFAEDRLAAFHAAFFGSGWVLHIPDDLHAEKPVHISLPAGGPLTVRHLILVAGARSRATVTVECTDATGLQLLSVEGFLREGARLSFALLHDALGDAWQSDILRFRLDKDSRLETISGLLGGGVTRSSACATLAGAGSDARLSACFADTANGVYDLALETRHEAPSTTSRILSSGLLGGTAQAAIRSRTHIAKGAFGSDARQDLRTLLLSPGAHASPIPELEIGNSDVRCGHAASTGRIRPEDLFYTMSRGLSRAEAVRLIAVGHVHAGLEAIADPLFRDVFQTALAERLASLSIS